MAFLHRGLLWLCALATLLAACGTPAPIVPTAPAGRAEPAAATPDAAFSAMFAYGAGAPPALEEIASEMRGDVRVRDITFPSPNGEKVPAYLLEPPGAGSHPGVLYVHWYGDRASNRDEFVDEALDLAQGGAVVLLVDDLFAQPVPRHRWKGAGADEDRAIVIEQIVELRIALDLLVAQPGVDAARLAFVGHDFGAMFGAVLAGADPRVKYYVLMTPTTDFADWFLRGSLLKGEERTKYTEGMAAVAPIHAITHASGAAFLFQFADDDSYVSAAQARALFDAAPEPKVTQTYDSGHALHRNARATQDRLDWLKKQLGLGSPNP
jgi:dienelactone hydrolase